MQSSQNLPSTKSGQPSSDLHARARIRNAALHQFSHHGFQASLRAIALEAGVSPALIVHHFGSKEALRKACDEYTMEVITATKLESAGENGPENMLAHLAQLEEFAPVASYAVASLAAGGELAQTLIDQMEEMTLQTLETGIETGTMKPSYDLRGRARYMTLSSLGLLMLSYRIHSDNMPGEMVDLKEVFLQLSEEIVGPSLEIYTEGLFTDDRYLTAYHNSLPTSETESGSAP